MLLRVAHKHLMLCIWCGTQPLSMMLHASQECPPLLRRIPVRHLIDRNALCLRLCKLNVNAAAHALEAPTNTVKSCVQSHDICDVTPVLLRCLPML